MRRGPGGRFVPEPEKNGREVMDDRGRVRVRLGRGHPYADSKGWCWRSRLVVQEILGRRLLTCEHVHHGKGGKADDRPENLEVWLAEYHGRYHAWGWYLAGNRDGPWAEVEQPEPYPIRLPRFGAIIGESAKLEQELWGRRAP